MTELWQHIIADFSNLGSPAALSAFVQVLMIDVMLAGDNAIVVGAIAAGLTPQQRKKVILIGIIAALLLRIVFALAVHRCVVVAGGNVSDDLAVRRPGKRFSSVGNEEICVLDRDQESRLSPFDGDNPKASLSFMAGNESHALAVGRPAGIGRLPARRQQGR